MSSDEQSSSSAEPPPDAGGFTKRRAGRKKFRETRHPRYRGVRARNEGRRWVCEVREPLKKSRLWLGTWPAPEMAALAHDVAALALRGSSAALNFPELAARLPRAASASPEDVRRAAAVAARMFGPAAAAPEKEQSSAAVEEQATGPAMAYVDEDAVFGMPALVEEMARGMMLAPPAAAPATEAAGEEWNGDGFGMDWDLWG